MVTLKVTLGFILLFAGSQLHWLFAAMAGFVVGEYLMRQSPTPSTEWTNLFNALKYSVLNGIFALVLKPLAIIVSGFIMGAFILYELPILLGLTVNPLSWIFVGAAGVLAVIMLLVYYEFSVIVLSTVAGAVIVIQSARFVFLDTELLLLALIVMGVISQFIFGRYFEPTLD